MVRIRKGERKKEYKLLFASLSFSSFSPFSIESLPLFSSSYFTTVTSTCSV